MSIRFMTIIKKTFEEDYYTLKSGDYARLCISDEYRTEEYDLYLKTNSDYTGHNLDIINGETGEYLMSISIKPVIFPDDDQFRFDITHVAEDFNHTRKYSEKDLVYFVKSMDYYKGE